MRDASPVTRAQAVLRGVYETKDRGSGCWRGHYRGWSVGNEPKSSMLTPRYSDLEFD